MAEVLPKIHYAFIIDGETFGLTITDSPIRKSKEKMNLKVFYDAKTPVFYINFPLKECSNYTSTYMALDEGCIELYTYLFVNDEQILVIHERNKYLNPLENFWNNVLSFEDTSLQNITVIHKVLSHHYEEPILLIVKFNLEPNCFPKYHRIQ
eukprot:NODE_227_length_12294_cov_1.542681.p9 type:complete len:152 gc:universal NODE_227_length_12294_cov_1.542681:11542-11997(+)